MKERTLKDIVDYTSGSSWDGTHDRDIEITYQDVDNITVENVYLTHRIGDKFTFVELCRQLEETKSAHYFQAFCYEAGQKIPYFDPVTDARGNTTGLQIIATPGMIEAEVRDGVQNKVTAFQPFRFKPKM